LLGVVAATHLVRARFTRGAWTNHIAVGLFAALAILSYNGLSYLKFRTIDGCPLRYNVQYTPERLARIDGRQFHWKNVRYTFDAYFLKPPINLGKNFPYFHLSGLDTGPYPGLKMDMTEPMTGVPYAMPGLFLLTLAAFGHALLPGNRFRTPLLVVLVATVPMALAMFAAIAVSHRYTADFLGLFAIAGAFGLAAVDCGVPRARIAARIVVGTVVAAGVYITFALTLSFQGSMVWGQSKETIERYQRLREKAEQVQRWFHKA
jgi:hypothetical protein